MVNIYDLYKCDKKNLVHYIDKTDTLNNKESRILLIKPYVENVSSKWNNGTESSVMGLSFVCKNNKVDCVIFETTKYLGNIIDIFDKYDDFTEGTVYKKLIKYNLPYDKNTGKIGRYSLLQLIDKLEKEHIQSKILIDIKCGISILISNICILFIKWFILLLKNIKSRKSNKYGILYITELEETLDNPMIYYMKTKYKPKENLIVFDKIDDISDNTSYSYIVLYSLLPFSILYLIVQFFTKNMEVPWFMIAPPDWEFVVYLFIIFTSVFNVLIDICAYKISKYLLKYVIHK